MALEKITVPDFGGVQKITVIEVLVAVGDHIEAEGSLIALESEKAVMDIPSPSSGTIREVHLKEGDTVKSGDLIALIETEDATPTAEDPLPVEKPEQVSPPPPVEEKESTALPPQQPPAEIVAPGQQGAGVHASPSIRAYARELGIDLAEVQASGPKGRILKEDVQALVKRIVTGHASSPVTAGGSVLPEIPHEDFSVHGPVETVPLSRIQKISGPHLHRSWVGIPHVTHFDEADITDLESFRIRLNNENEKEGLRFSLLAFAVKAVAAILKSFPLFNSSLAPEGSIVLKKYCHIGIAVDTPNGLVAPVIKNADQMGLRDIALELARLGKAAREGRLTPAELQGASFTLSSLGGIGGTGFTPIVSAPQVAILGLARAAMKPTWNGEAFCPRLTLPFSVSYDHRIIDGAAAARFCRSLAAALEDLRRTLI